LLNDCPLGGPPGGLRYAAGHGPETLRSDPVSNPVVERARTAERPDATGWTVCPDCAGQLVRQLPILPAPEHLLACLRCGAEFVARQPARPLAPNATDRATRAAAVQPARRRTW